MCVCTAQSSVSMRAPQLTMPRHAHRCTCMALMKVNYVIHGLAKRLEEHHKQWLVTLKALIVFHRLMRETDTSFQVRCVGPIRSHASIRASPKCDDS